MSKVQFKLFCELDNKKSHICRFSKKRKIVPTEIQYQFCQQVFLQKKTNASKMRKWLVIVFFQHFFECFSYRHNTVEKNQSLFVKIDNRCQKPKKQKLATEGVENGKCFSYNDSAVDLSDEGKARIGIEAGLFGMILFLMIFRWCGCVVCKRFWYILPS